MRTAYIYISIGVHTQSTCSVPIEKRGLVVSKHCALLHRTIVLQAGWRHTLSSSQIYTSTILRLADVLVPSIQSNILISQTAKVG